MKTTVCVKNILFHDNEVMDPNSYVIVLINSIFFHQNN